MSKIIAVSCEHSAPFLKSKPGKGYRAGVGIVLLNGAGKVFVGSRIDTPGDHWQMPQGGIDKGEAPLTAVLREMEEEVGTAKAQIIAETDGWLSYDLPKDLRKKLWRGQYKGQVQKWYLGRFTGSDSDINLATEHPEFDRFQWVDAKDLPKLIVAFKQPLYQLILSCFADLIEKHGGVAHEAI